MQPRSHLLPRRLQYSRHHCAGSGALNPEASCHRQEGTSPPDCLYLMAAKQRNRHTGHCRAPGNPAVARSHFGPRDPCVAIAMLCCPLQLTAAAEPQHIPWSGPKWVVAAACLTLKGGRTDWLVEKATELGAHSLLPLITARSQTGTNKDKFKALAHKAGQNKRQRTATGDDASSRMHAEGGSEFQASRLERLAVAATKQSLRTHGLQVQPAIALDQLLPDLQAAPVSVVAMAGAPPILQMLQQQWQQAQQQQQLVEAGGPPQACIAPEQQAAQVKGLHRAPPITHPWCVGGVD